MANHQIILTKQGVQVLGEVKEENSKTITMYDPVIIVPIEDKFILSPFYEPDLTDEKEAKFSKADLLVPPYKPTDKLMENYLEGRPK